MAEEEEGDKSKSDPFPAPTPRPPPSSSQAPEIPVEIVSEDEMIAIEIALSAAASRFSCSTKLLSSSSSSPPKAAARRFRSSRTLSGCSSGGSSSDDIEDSGRPGLKRRKGPVSLLERFRTRSGLAVTDITASEWCEKQMEFMLLHGRPERTDAMKAGSNRHAQLEEEVVKRLEVHIQTIEDSWAVKLTNFIVGANQLLFDGLTREIPIIGFVEGIWITGVIDEVRMPLVGTYRNPSLIDTKTRSRATLPTEAQKRNARFQLMCYKYLWDSIVADNFPLAPFFDYFGLDPQVILSDDVKHYFISSGIEAQTLGELMTYFRNICCLLPPAHDQLLLRYEFQGDHSLLDEYHFLYDLSWVESQIRSCLEFWTGEREADFVAVNEKWKCRFCSFSSICSMASKLQETEI